jgi:hypothetical protein
MSVKLLDCMLCTLVPNRGMLVGIMPRERFSAEADGGGDLWRRQDKLDSGFGKMNS